MVSLIQVLIWRSDCSASLYQLTRRCHTQMELKDVDGVGVEPAPPDAPEATICLCELRASDPFPALQPAFSFFHLSHPLASSKKVPNRLFLTGNSSGQLHAWYLPVQVSSSCTRIKTPRYYEIMLPYQEHLSKCSA